MKHITPTPGKMCFSFAIKKAPANRRSENKNFICKFEITHSRKLGALYQFMVRKPDGVAQKQHVILLRVLRQR